MAASRFYEPWRDQAACKEENPDIFFPSHNVSATYAAALAVCSLCPVRQDCLDDAVEYGEKDGIWGGTTPEERKPMIAKAAARAIRNSA